MMKLNKFVYWLKKDKVYLALFIAFCVCFILDISVIIFDIVEIIKTSANSAALSNAFLALNIITIVLNIILVIALFAVIMIKGKK